MVNLLHYLRFQRVQSIKAASAILAIAAVLSNGLGLVRDVIFYRFIPLPDLDIYYASFRIPDFLFNLIIFGAMSNAFVPVITELLSKKDSEQAQKVTNQVLSLLTVLFIVVGIILIIFMNPIMRALVPAFDESRFVTTVALSRLMLIQTILFAWSFTIGGYLNSHRRFGSYALAPLLYNVSIIIGGLLAPRFGIRGVAYAVIIGALLHLLVQYTEARKAGFRPRLEISISPYVRKIVGLMIPRSISQGMAQVVFMVYTALASALTPGSLSIFSGMNNLQTTPTVIIANSLAVAFFPTITAQIVEQDWDRMNNLLTKVMRAALFLLLPTIALAFILRAQLIRLYFGIGGASWPETQIAIDTFVWFLVGIIPASLVVLLAKVFYAFKDSLTPMYISLFAGVVAIIVATVGINYFNGNVSVLAISTTALSYVQCALFIFYLYKRDHIRFDFNNLTAQLFSYFLGSLLMAFTTWGALQLVARWYESTDFLGTHVVYGLFLQLLIAAVVGVLTYLGYSRIVHKEELEWLKRKRFSSSQ